MKSVTKRTQTSLGIWLGRLRNKLTTGNPLPPRIEPPGYRHRLAVPVDVVEGVTVVAGFDVGARGCCPRSQNDTAQQGRAEWRADHLRHPGRFPESRSQADPDEHRRGRWAGTDQRHAVAGVFHAHVHLERAMVIGNTHFQQMSVKGFEKRP